MSDPGTAESDRQEARDGPGLTEAMPSERTAVGIVPQEPKKRQFRNVAMFTGLVLIAWWDQHAAQDIGTALMLWQSLSAALKESNQTAGETVVSDTELDREPPKAAETASFGVRDKDVTPMVDEDAVS